MYAARRHLNSSMEKVEVGRDKKLQSGQKLESNVCECQDKEMERVRERNRKREGVIKVKVDEESKEIRTASIRNVGERREAG